MEGHSTVSGKSPKLTRCSCHISHGIGHSREGEDQSHCCRSTFRPCSIVEDLNKRVAGRCVQYSFEVSEVVDKCANRCQQRSDFGHDRSYISMTKPRAPLTPVVYTITRGSVLEASLNSSAICTAASAPSIDVTGVTRPTSVANPACRR